MQPTHVTVIHHGMGPLGIVLTILVILLVFALIIRLFTGPWFFGPTTVYEEDDYIEPAVGIGLVGGAILGAEIAEEIADEEIIVESGDGSVVEEDER